MFQWSFKRKQIFYYILFSDYYYATDIKDQSRIQNYIGHRWMNEKYKIYFWIEVKLETTSCGSVIYDVIKKLFARVTGLKKWE